MCTVIIYRSVCGERFCIELNVREKMECEWGPLTVFDPIPKFLFSFVLLE